MATTATRMSCRWVSDASFRATHPSAHTSSVRHSLAAFAFLAAACGDNHDHAPDGPLPTTDTVTVEVPATMTDPPFDVPRTLTVPAGWGIRVIARVPTARFLAETPEGNLLVSRPADGSIHLVTGSGTSRTEHQVTSGLNQGHDMVFAVRGGTTYLYISEHDRVSRVAWDPSAQVLGTLEPIVTDLPSSSLPELMGAYGHGLKNIAIAGDTLYVSIASATNADESDILADPVRGSIYSYPADGGTGRLYAKGLHNAEGLAIHPRTGELWAAVNHRDMVRYPLHDGRYPYGEIVIDYVNDNPPEPFTRVRDGGNYGWPYCNPTAVNGVDNMPFLPDIYNNEKETKLDCSSIDRVSKGLPAHAAPLGMSFWTGDSAPAEYRDGAVIGMHGCWDCSVPHGFEVGFIPIQDDDSFGDLVDLVTGFLDDPANPGSAWGRPVDAIPSSAGTLYISDDKAGAVYELYRR